MLRTFLVSAASLTLLAGAAGAQTVIYDDGYVALGAPVIVERRAAVIPGPVVTYVEPAPRVVVIPELRPLPPGALTTPSDTDSKRVARPLPRYWRTPGAVVVYP